MRAGLLAVGNFTAIGVRQAVYMLISLTIGMSVREYARAWTATRLRRPDASAVGPSHAQPEGVVRTVRQSGLVPVLLAVLWAVWGVRDPRRLREAGTGRSQPLPPRTTRDIVLVSLAGPVATLVLGILGGPGGAGRLLAAGRGVPVRTGADATRACRWWSSICCRSRGSTAPGIVALLLPPRPVRCTATPTSICRCSSWWCSSSSARWSWAS